MKPSTPVFVFRFRDSLEANMVTVVAIRTDHRLSTYRLPTLAKPSADLRRQSTSSRPDRDRDAAPERRKSRAEPGKDSVIVEGRKGAGVFVSPVRDAQ